jgi:hypothetical protein
LDSCLHADRLRGLRHDRHLDLDCFSRFDCFDFFRGLAGVRGLVVCVRFSYRHRSGLPGDDQFVRLVGISSDRRLCGGLRRGGTRGGHRRDGAQALAAQVVGGLFLHGRALHGLSLSCLLR